KYVLTVKGDLFANRSRRSNPLNEVASQTRYDATFGQGFKLPLFGSFSLQPKFEWFYYQNKVFESGLTKRNFDIQLTYDFSCRSRVGLWQRLGYDSAGSGQKQ